MNKRFLFSVASLAFLVGCAHHQPEVVGPAPAPSHVRRSAYDKPLSTPGYRFGSLPQAVRNTLLAEAGMAEIRDVRTQMQGERVVYEIFFNNERVNPPLYVGSDGSVLHPDGTIAVSAPAETLNLNVNDVPPAVSRLIKEKATEKDVTTIRRENWGDHVVYVVSFKDEVRNPKLFILAEGVTVVPAR